MSTLTNFFKVDQLEESKISEIIKEATPIYNNEVKKFFESNLSLADRFLLEAAQTGSVQVLKAAINSGANVNSILDGRNEQAFQALAGRIMAQGGLRALNVK
jgi:hypothetical protein